MSRRNLTLQLDEELIRRAKVLAARRGTSVSGILGERYPLSFWDALIVAAAEAVGAERLVSEDFQPGLRIEGVLIENPFAHIP